MPIGLGVHDSDAVLTAMLHGDRLEVLEEQIIGSVAPHGTTAIPGGFHVPSPGGRMEGASVFGQ